MTCPSCAQNITAGAKFCRFCGAVLTSVSPPPVRRDDSRNMPPRDTPRHSSYLGDLEQSSAQMLSESQTQSASSPQSFCMTCGHRLPSGVTSCPDCEGTTQSPRVASAYVSSLNLTQLRDPGENTAFTVLLIFAIPLILALLVAIIATFGLLLLLALAAWMTQAMIAASIKVNGLRVSATQYPEINQIVVDCSRRLGLSPPDVYLFRQDNVFNAFAVRLARRCYVILEPELVDAILLKGDLQQLTFIIGHELGHHAAGHTAWWQMLVRMGSWVPALGLWYSRRCELTCDRIGLYCSGSAFASQTAIANMLAGAQLAGQVNSRAVLDQWEQHHDEFFVRYLTIYSTHPTLLWRYAELMKAARELGISSSPALPRSATDAILR